MGLSYVAAGSELRHRPSQPAARRWLFKISWACSTAEAVTLSPDSMRAQLCDTLGFGEFGDRRKGFLLVFPFLDEVVCVGETGDLWQVRDAQYLMAACQLLQAAADGFSDAAPRRRWSISSNTSVRWMAPCFGESAGSRQVLSAKVTLDSSPPEATVARGRAGWPGFADMRKRILSTPEADQAAWSPSSKSTSENRFLHRQRRQLFLNERFQSLARLAAFLGQSPRQAFIAAA